MSRHADLHRRSACARTVLLHECTDAECQFNHSLLDSALLEHVVAASLRSSRQCMVALVCSIRAGRVRWGSYMRTESRAGLSVVHTVPNASTARESLRKVLQKSQVVSEVVPSPALLLKPAYISPHRGSLIQERYAAPSKRGAARGEDFAPTATLFSMLSESCAW